MGKRGPKPRRSDPIVWSADLAYAVGLIATDGNLSSSGRHIELTSNDMEQLENFKKCLLLNTKVTYKSSGYTGKKTSRIQFGDVVLYKFLQDIGLTVAKTKTIGAISVPDKYFFDFLRGHHDGDGCFFSYRDPRWKSSYMFYLVFISASEEHILWIRNQLQDLLAVKGCCTKRSKRNVYQLRYAKQESLKILKKLYPTKDVTCLSRKRLKIEQALSIVGEQL